eukprot:2754634-Lingulodinium_polyedra.AAC.1
MRYDADLEAQWSEHARRFLMTDERARVTESAKDTSYSTLQLSVGFFNMGNLARQQHPGGTAVKTKVKG